MPLDPETRLEKGDRVAIHATVRYSQISGATVSVTFDDHSEGYLGRQAIDRILRSSFKPGDLARVTAGPHSGLVGPVRATFGEYVWIELDGVPETFAVSDLERLAPEIADAAPEAPANV